MTDNEIKCEKCFHQYVCEKRTCAECAGGYCDECELYSQYDGRANIKNCEDFVDADLINRQKAEINRLDTELKVTSGVALSYKVEVERLKDEADKIAEDYSNLMIEKDELFDEAEKLITKAKIEAVKEFAERILKKVHDNHYVLEDAINSKDYGMFTVGIEQAVNETKKEMVGEG